MARGFVTLQATQEGDNKTYNIDCNSLVEARRAGRILMGDASLRLAFVRIRCDGRDDEYLLGKAPRKATKKVAP